MIKDCCVIVPVYNEAPVLAGVVNGLTKQFEKVLCVDDASTDNSYEVLRTTKAIIIQHAVNLGQGAAIETGIQFALQYLDTPYYITFDADDQHRIENAVGMLDHIKKQKLDIVLGSRFLGSTDGMPGFRKLVIRMGALMTSLSYGMKLTDAHNGLRVLSKKSALLMQFSSPKMGHASEIMGIIKKNKLSYSEYPVLIRYTDYSKAKSQPLVNMVNIFFELLSGEKK